MPVLQPGSFFIPIKTELLQVSSDKYCISFDVLIKGFSTWQAGALEADSIAVEL